jgi:hypothetical protein
MTTERPILFSGPMVLAILSGRKTQTRRVIKTVADRQLNQFLHYMATAVDPDLKCPYGKPGDRLWVRETWAKTGFDLVTYRADNTTLQMVENHEWDHTDWRPSIHMPRWASRITLEITGVRAERLQAIVNNPSDCIAEGISHPDGYDFLWQRYDGEMSACSMPWVSFSTLWDSINAKRGYGWDQNPWVWAIEFKRVEI